MCQRQEPQQRPDPHHRGLCLGRDGGHRPGGLPGREEIQQEQLQQHGRLNAGLRPSHAHFILLHFNRVNIVHC